MKGKCFKDTIALIRSFTVSLLLTLFFAVNTSQRFKTVILSFVVGNHIQEIITIFQLREYDLVRSRITSPMLLPLTQSSLKFIYKNIMTFSAYSEALYAYASLSLSLLYVLFSTQHAVI